MPTTTHQAILVADLGFGDAGKGGIVDYLTRVHTAQTVVRYNGGAQAAHNVVTPDGRHHTFAQFGAGSFVPGARTLLSRFMLVDPLALLAEERHLRTVGVGDALARLFIEREALVVTPLHQAMNRLRELRRGAGRHGSCGMGIGETMADALARPDEALRTGDLADPAVVRRKIALLQAAKRAELDALPPLVPDGEATRRELAPLLDPRIGDTCAEVYADILRRVTLIDRDRAARLLRQPGTVVFEGAQGVLLDEWHGFHPYTTWSTTTFANADTLLAEADYPGAVTRLGVLRAYSTRHGPGPFVTEDAALTTALPDRHNATNAWQRAFRVGHLDLVATRYALAVAGPVDALAVTNLDRLTGRPAWTVCDAYHYAGPPADLTGLFAHSGPLIQSILPHCPPDLDRQATLTARLAACQPIYDDYPRAAAPDDPGRAWPAWCERLGDWLGAPVTLASAGPTAVDKTVLAPARRCRLIG